MAQGDYFQLGVEVPIANWRFEKWDRFAYFKAAVTSGARLFTADGSLVTADLSTVTNGALAVGNSLVLGPSTHANNLGATETIAAAVMSISGGNYFIDAAADLDYDYAAGDPMSYQTAPLGWTPTTDGGVTASRLYSRDTGVLYGQGAAGIDHGIGYAAKITRESNGAGLLHKIYYTTKVNTLLASNGVHRLSATGKGTGDTSQNILQLDTYRSNDVLVSSSKATLLFNGHTSYTEHTATFTPDATKGRIIQFIETGVGELTTFSLTNITLEHAAGIAPATGYYTATEWADEGSIKFDKITKETNTELLNNSVAYADASGGRLRYWLTAQFSDVPQAFYDAMTMLDKHCRLGKNIVFRPFIDDLPPVMVGKIRVSDMNKQHPGLSYRSFSFRFEEV